MKKIRDTDSDQERPEEPEKDGATEETDEEKEEETNVKNGDEGNADPVTGSREAEAGSSGHTV